MMERPLRFCLITTFYPPYSFGGDAIYVQQLAHELAERGHHVEVVHCLDSYKLLARGEIPRPKSPHSNITVHTLHSEWGALSPLATQQTGYPFFKTKQISEILARGFDVIHYHNLSLVGGPKLLEVGDAVKLYTTHEYWLVCPMSVLFRYDGVACEEKKCLRCTLAYHRPPQWWRYTNMLQDAVRHVDMFIHPSRFCMEKHGALGLQDKATLLRYFRPRARMDDAPRVPQHKPYFLFAGRLELLKGIHTVIPLFRDYARARLVIAGEGSQSEDLKELAAASPNIEFKGWLDPSALAALYRNATALIVPSLCFEAGPLVVLEAMQHRTPIVGRSIGAIPEIVEEYGNGIVYTDNQSFCAALDVLLDNPARRDEMGERGYAAYEESYTPEAHLSRYLNIIQEVVERKKVPGIK